MPPLVLMPPHAVRFRGSRLSAAVLRLGGWRVLQDGFPARQGVAVVYPHTSNWDFIVMLLAKWTVGIQVRFWAKDTLFAVPVFGRWLRWLGGMPIDRQSPRGSVGAMVDRLRAARDQDEFLWLGLSPEGTRRHTPGWRSGFYQVATGADLPVALVALDYSRREVRMTDFVRLNGDAADDYAHIAAVYAGATGFNAEQASPVQPLQPLPKISTADTV